jgi:hypothetical protein
VSGRILICVIGLVGAAVVAAQDRPLPEREAFLRETRKHLQTDSSLQSSYVYVETRREQKLDRRNRPTEMSEKVYESYPGLPGESRWERLLSENGRPVAAANLAKQDRERQKRGEEIAERLTEQPVKERAGLERKQAELRREREEAVEDVFIVFDIRMLGRETIDGHDTIAFALTPRPDSKPKTREGGQMRKFSVRAWVSESDHELVRLDAEAIDTMSVGFGLLARLHKGSKLSFLRRRVNGEVWLPAMFTYSGSARVGLVRTLRRSGTSEYSAYRKFGVETSFKTTN